MEVDFICSLKVKLEEFPQQLPSSSSPPRPSNQDQFIHPPATISSLASEGRAEGEV